MQPVPSTGEHSTGAKHRKTCTCNRVPRAGKSKQVLARFGADWLKKKKHDCCDWLEARCKRLFAVNSRRCENGANSARNTEFKMSKTNSMSNDFRNV